MFRKLIAALTGIRQGLHGTGRTIIPPAEEEMDALRDIEFTPMSPETSSAGGDRLLCPVTRRELRPGDRIYWCRACQTAFSAAGWDFLKQVDRGKCCGCGMRNTVFLLD